MDPEIKLAFLEEAAQLLTDSAPAFQGLTSHPDQMDLLDQIYRVAHNIKGGAKAVGFEALSSFARQQEAIIGKIRKKEAPLTAPLLDLLTRSKDLTSSLVEILRKNPDAPVDTTVLSKELDAYLGGQSG